MSRVNKLSSSVSIRSYSYVHVNVVSMKKIGQATIIHSDIFIVSVTIFQFLSVKVNSGRTTNQRYVRTNLEMSTS